MMSSRAVKIGAGLFAIGWAFRNPKKLLAILIPMFVLQCFLKLFEIPEADFPKVIEVLAVVKQPYEMANYRGALIKVRNNATFLLQPDNIVFICRYATEDGPGVRSGFVILNSYSGSKDLPPGTTKMLPIQTTGIAEISGCKAAKTDKQAASLYGLRVGPDVISSLSGYDKYDASGPWQPPMQTKSRS